LPVVITILNNKKIKKAPHGQVTYPVRDAGTISQVLGYPTVYEIASGGTTQEVFKDTDAANMYWEHTREVRLNKLSDADVKIKYPTLTFTQTVTKKEKKETRKE